MNTDKPFVGRMWAHVHGELSGEELENVERAIAADPALQKQETEIRAFDKQLRALTPLTDANPDALADRIIEELDTTQKPQQEDTMNQQTEKRSNIIEWMARSHALRVGAVLAAAAIVVAFALPYYMGGPIRWAEPEFAPLQYRGGEVPSESMYTATDATACLELMRQVAEAYPQKAAEDLPWWKRRACRWRLKIRFQELPQGRFALVVQALGRKAQPAQEWSRHFTDMDDFRAQSDGWVKEIAEELASLETGGR